MGSEKFCGEITQGGEAEVRKVVVYQLESQQDTDDMTVKSNI